MVDGYKLGRKSFVKRLAKGALGVLDSELKPRQMNNVVRVGTGFKLQCAVRQPSQQPPKLPVDPWLRANTADVMHARRESPAMALEGLCQSASNFVLFKYEHPLFSLGQCSGRS